MSISYAVHRDLHSFPTRRSSDLFSAREAKGSPASPTNESAPPWRGARRSILRISARLAGGRSLGAVVNDLFFLAVLFLDLTGCFLALRSEEHTSELQSHVNLVCRPPRPTLFPYTTLFRSIQCSRGEGFSGFADQRKRPALARGEALDPPYLCTASRRPESRCGRERPLLPRRTLPGPYRLLSRP